MLLDFITKHLKFSVKKSGVNMDFITNLFSGLDFQVILQLTSVSLILIAGPVIVFILYALRGDL